MTTKPPIKPPVKPSYLRNAAQNGNIPSISDKGPGKDSEGTDTNSNSVPGKSRNSQVNIPAAFRSQSVDDKATKPKPPPPPTRKPVNKDGDDTPTPSWKKSNETQKPDPPWKQKLNENLAEKLGARQSNLNDNSSSDEPKKPDPPWKKNLHRNENGSQGESNTSGAKSDKPIPPWKQAILDRQKKDQDEKKDEKKDIPVAPPWKAKNEEADDKPTPPWKVPKKTNDDNVPVNKTDKPIPPWKQKASEKSDPKPPPPPQTAKPKSDVPNIAPATNKAELENIFKNLKRTPSKDGEPVLLRGPKRGDSLKRKMSRKSYTRVSDEKKFILIDVDDVDMDSTPPPKPARLVSFTELEEIIADYKAQLDGISKLFTFLMCRKI
ncbi:hypothetical protein FSP39_024052 [Pinctada imbricata]|uniref:Uncharacterized protein n=1 Tax=Pinctada imbricata TaxID=66713 RepID=A0AA88XTA5_PINIB|nr:hypothetical protein FSP39_024052 [Pinctada imbricata]